jgi:DNA-directed RNA polymerase alpha subunit
MRQIVVSKLPLDDISIHALSNAGVTKLNDLFAMTDKQILSLPGIGKRRWQVIKQLKALVKWLERRRSLNG